MFWSGLDTMIPQIRTEFKAMWELGVLGVGGIRALKARTTYAQCPRLQVHPWELPSYKTVANSSRDDGQQDQDPDGPTMPAAVRLERGSSTLGFVPREKMRGHSTQPTPSMRCG
jgi:hypothetical protein